MEIKKVYWRQEAINNLKEIFVVLRRQGKKTPLNDVITKIEEDIEYLKESPYRGYVEPSLRKVDKNKKIYSYYINKYIQVLYYIEKKNMYIVDFWRQP